MLDRVEPLASLLHVAQPELFGFPLLAQAGQLAGGAFAFPPWISARRSTACSSVSSASWRSASSSCVRRRWTCVDFAGHAFQLHRQPAGGFVDQVDGLVGQEAIGDVAVRQLGRGDEGRIFDLARLVMRFVARLQAAEDGDRVVDRRLADEDRLEAAFQGGVFFDVLAIFVERRRADAAEFAAGERRLEQVGGVGGPLRPRRRRPRCAVRR